MSVVLPFLFGLILAYLINPLVEWFTAMGYRRSRIVLVLYVLLLGMGIGLGSWLLPGFAHEANSVVSNFPSYAADINAVIAGMNKDIHEVLFRIIGSRADAFVIPFNAEILIEMLFSKLPSNILNVAHLGLWIFIIPFVCYYALNDGKKWIESLFQLTPSDRVEHLLGLLAEVNATLGGYVRGVCLESFCVGLLTIVGLAAMGINGAILLGVATAFLNIVPFMALFIGGGVALITGFFQTGSLSVLMGILLLYGAVRLIDDFLIIPFVMGRSVRLHPVVVLFAVLAGVKLGGVVGLIFAIPIAALFKVIFSVLIRDRQEQVLLSRSHIYS